MSDLLQIMDTLSALGKHYDNDRMYEVRMYGDCIELYVYSKQSKGSPLIGKHIISKLKLDLSAISPLQTLKNEFIDLDLEMSRKMEKMKMANEYIPTYEEFMEALRSVEEKA